MGSAIATVTGLLVVSPELRQKIGAQEASKGTGRGGIRGLLVGIQNPRSPDVTRSDRLKGNFSVTYVTRM